MRGSISAAVATWLDEQVHRPGTRTMLATTVANLFATEPANLSFLHVLFYLRSGGGWESLVRTEGGAQQDRLVGGLQEPAVRLASCLGEVVRPGRRSGGSRTIGRASRSPARAVRFARVA